MERTGRFYFAVGAILENNKKILMMKRSARDKISPSEWHAITGGVNQFESPQHALLREIKEETGIADVKIIKPIDTFHFFVGERIAKNEVIGIVYWCKTRSKKVILSEEHDDFVWVTPKDAIKLTTHVGVKSNIKAYIRESALYKF
jgi:8-oxo-dGTP diphosphatase